MELEIKELRGHIMNILKICGQFGIDALRSQVISKGLINNSWKVTAVNGETYIVQSINTNVFKNVDKLMDNISKVTTHIKEKVENSGGDPSREVLQVVPCLGDKQKLYYKSEDDNQYFRVYRCIDNANTYDDASLQLLYQAGVGFGKFQQQLSDFPSDTLYESIPDFHNTIKRFETFEQKLDNLSFEEYTKARKEIIKTLKGFEYARKIMEPLTNHEIPQRVVHNDTKLNNVMLDDNDHHAVCVIDLDTIMPGSLLFDYGDAIRFCANTGAEDDRNIDNVGIAPKKFVAFTHGFLSQTAERLTEKELSLMSVAPLVITYELSLRFLTDYLDGNKYFKTDPSRPDHNLERARAQLKLFDSFKEHESDMDRTIKKIYYLCLDHNLKLSGGHKVPNVKHLNRNREARTIAKRR